MQSLVTRTLIAALAVISVVLLTSAPALAQAVAAAPEAAAAAPGWVQTAGLLGFAAAVLWELRQQRTERIESERNMREVITKLSDGITALLERQRMNTEPHGVPRIITDIKS